MQVGGAGRGATRSPSAGGRGHSAVHPPRRALRGRLVEERRGDHGRDRPLRRVIPRRDPVRASARPPLTLLAVLGAIVAAVPRLSRGSRWVAGLHVWLLVTVASLLLNPLPWQRYYLPLIPVATVLVGVGVSALVRLATRLVARPRAAASAATGVGAPALRGSVRDWEVWGARPTTGRWRWSTYATGRLGASMWTDTKRAPTCFDRSARREPAKRAANPRTHRELSRAAPRAGAIASCLGLHRPATRSRSRAAGD